MARARGVGSLSSRPFVSGLIVMTLAMWPLSAFPLSIGDPPEVFLPLDGIMAVYNEGRHASYYFPEVNTWPRPNVVLYPIVAATDSGQRVVILRITLLDVPRKAAETLTLRVDGAFYDLPLDAKGAITFDGDGCRRATTVTLGGQSDVVRRIADAKQVELAFGKGKSRTEYRLVQEDLERFARIVKLVDMKTLPPATRKVDEEYEDGEVIGPNAEVVTNPRLIRSSKVTPRYPENARRRKLMGKVTLGATILKDGAVGDLKVLRAAGRYCGFEESAMAAVKKWRYEPGMVDGEPVDVYFTVVVDYVLGRGRQTQQPSQRPDY